MTDDGTRTTFFFFFFVGHRCLTVVFQGATELQRLQLQVALSVYWDVTLAVIPVYVCKIKKRAETPVMHSFIHISLILFFLCILWLLWCALSCHRVQADLFSWCMHNLVVMKPAWRRGATKAQEAYVCVYKVSAGCSWCGVISAVMRPQSRGKRLRLM